MFVSRKGADETAEMRKLVSAYAACKCSNKILCMLVHIGSIGLEDIFSKMSLTLTLQLLWLKLLQ